MISPAFAAEQIIREPVFRSASSNWTDLGTASYPFGSVYAASVRAGAVSGAFAGDGSALTGLRTNGFISLADATNAADAVYSNNPAGYQDAAHAAAIANNTVSATLAASNAYAGSFAGNGYALTNFSTNSFPALNSPTNGMALRYTNLAPYFYWAK